MTVDWVIALPWAVAVMVPCLVYLAWRHSR